MIPNSMTRYPPPPVAGPKPRMWKSLGMISRSTAGFIEAHYELASFDGDLDVDSEDAVRGAVQGLLAALASVGRGTDPDEVYTLQRPSGALLRVKIVSSFWDPPGVDTTVMGRA